MEDQTGNHKPFSQFLNEMMFEQGWSNAALQREIDDLAHAAPDPSQWEAPSERSIGHLRQGKYDVPKKRAHANRSLRVVAQFMIKTARDNGQPELADRIEHTWRSLGTGHAQDDPSPVLAERPASQPDLAPIAADLARRRVIALCPPLPPGIADYRKPDVAALGAWAGVDIRWTVAVMEGSKRFYEETKTDADAVACLNLSLGLAYRELWAPSPETRIDTTYLAKARTCLREALETFEPDLYGVNFLQRAVALDRLGMVELLSGDYKAAKEAYAKARKALEGRHDPEAHLMTAWVDLNDLFRLFAQMRFRALSAANDGAARMALGRSVRIFQALEDRNALWHVVAAAGCYAVTKSDYTRALDYLDMVPKGDRTDAVGPTYFVFTDAARSGRGGRAASANIPQGQVVHRTLDAILVEIMEWLTILKQNGELSSQ